MNDVLLQLALRFLGLSLVAVGGANALVPAIHAQAVVNAHWMDDRSFTELIALAQVSPGPNLLLVPLVGWRVAGIAGALVALVAFVIPSTAIAIAGARALQRHEGTSIVATLRWALRPVGGGLMLAAAIEVFFSAAHAWPGATARTTIVLAAIAVPVAAASLRFKVNPLVWIAAAAVAGALVPLR